EGLGFRGHERGLLAFGQTVQREEAIEHGGPLGLFSPAEARAGRALEAAHLASQLVTLFLAEALHVRLVVGGQRDTRAGDHPLARDAVARGAQHLVERGESW